MPRTRTRVCPVPSCPELVGPEGVCAHGHGRPRNAPWTPDRDRGQQHAFRKATLTRDKHTCTRCGHHDKTGRSLDAHHDPSGQGVTLCNGKANGCHAAVDGHAR